MWKDSRRGGDGPPGRTGQTGLLQAGPESGL